MNKNLVIILEGPDRCGKGTFIEMFRNICNSPYIGVIHCSKPPEKITMFHKQWAAAHYSNMMKNINNLSPKNITILDRSYIGEFVYGPLYRDTKYDYDEFKQAEKQLLNFETTNYVSVYFSDSPTKLVLRDDGKSHTDSIQHKELELKAFDEMFKRTIIPHQLFLDWRKNPFDEETFKKYINHIIKYHIKRDIHD